jgi:hypothetical protein
LWFRNVDVISFPVQPVLESISSAHVVSKRFVLSILSKLFDPLCHLIPFSVRLKLLFQNLWLLKIPWDDTLPPELLQKLLEWAEELKLLKDYVIPRSLKPPELSLNYKCELHLFSDASQVSYGAAAYICYEDQDTKKRFSRLLMAKNRLVSLKVNQLSLAWNCVQLSSQRKWLTQFQAK